MSRENSPLLPHGGYETLRAGKPFWGCPGYPDCQGTVNIRYSVGSDLSDESDEAQ
ncbi:MAG: hypothetical protein ABFR33_10105 [Verrucomicrobiota bacterium]